MRRSAREYFEHQAKSLSGVPRLEENLNAIQLSVSELAGAVERTAKRSERHVRSNDLRFEAHDGALKEKFNEFSTRLEQLAASLTEVSLLKENVSAVQGLVSDLVSAVERSERQAEGFAARCDERDAALKTKIHEVSTRLSDVSTRLNWAVGTRADNVIPLWYEWNFWEPSVQLALRDLCHSGDTVFDVGANTAALSVLMSRLVGPQGKVYAFEASRRIVEKAQFNVVQNGCTNVQLFHRAVYHKSGERLAIFEGSHLNDSIFSLGTGEAKSSILSISLDDFADHWGAQPILIKMDIEGAEFDALMGSKKLIQAAWPHLILEQQPSDTRCIDWLLSQGYVALDLANYRSLTNAADISSGSLVNVLFIHRSRIDGTPFKGLGEPVLIRESGPDELNFNLDAGRYVAEALIAAEGTDNEIMAGVEINGEPATRYHTHTRFLADSYRFLPFHLNDRGDVEVFFRFQSQTSDPTFTLSGVRLWKVAGAFPRTDLA